MASVIFSQQEQSGDLSSCTATDPNTGVSITFNNSETMRGFVDGNIGSVSLEAIEAVIGPLGTGTFAFTTYGDKVSGVFSLLGDTSNKLGYISLTIDAIQWADNKNFDTTSDLIISGIGVFGVPGGCISIGLTFAKMGGEGVVTAATGMARFNAAFEKNPWGSFFTLSSNFGGPTRLR